MWTRNKIMIIKNTILSEAYENTEAEVGDLPKRI